MRYLPLTGLTLIAACVAQESTLAPVPERSEIWQDANSTVVVHMVYGEGRWVVGEGGVKVLPCPPPSEDLVADEKDPLVQVFGEEGQTIYATRVRNPRLKLIEEPSSEPNLLDQAEVYLQLPLHQEMQEIRFFDPFQKRDEKPSLTVNIQKAKQAFVETGGQKLEAPCQPIDLLPDQLKRE